MLSHILSKIGSVIKCDISVHIFGLEADNVLA